MDSTPEAALRQIEEKQCSLQFETSGKSIIKIGANFSTKTRRLTGWLIES